MSDPIVGLDLDNTIIDYTEVFAPVAEEIGLLPANSRLASKQAVKAHLREEGGEEAWMRLQGQVYGRFIQRAKPHIGCKSFIREVRSRGARIAIVSHKTRYGHFDRAEIDLWEAARGWLEEWEFFNPSGAGIDPADVYFETTREAKIERIRAVGCQVFVDDIPEVLNHPNFPKDAQGLWFAMGRDVDAGGGLKGYLAWSDLMDKVLSIL